MPVTLEPKVAVGTKIQVPVPELVIKPALLRAPVCRAMPLKTEPLQLRTRLPVPITPPFTVIFFVFELFVSVVPPLFTVIAPLTVRAEVALFKVTPVTFAPIPPLIVVVPVPAPILVTVPTLLIATVEKVMVPLVAFELMVRLLVPVTPPEKVVDIAVPVLPMVRVPVVPVARTIGLAWVKPLVVAAKSEALAVPLVSPMVMMLELAPKELALVAPATIPERIDKPPVKVLTPDKVSCEVALF